MRVWSGSTREQLLIAAAYVLAHVAALVNLWPHLGALT
jgi:hypothetical protein